MPMKLIYDFCNNTRVCSRNNLLWILVLTIVFQFVVNTVAAPAYPHISNNIQQNDRLGRARRAPHVEVRNSTYHGFGPREEARAMCSVRTQEINATANATITRRLHGVVTSRELHSSIQRLELIIFGQMQQLWQSLDAMRSQLARVGASAGVPTAAGFPDRRTVAFRYQPDGG